MKRRILSLVLAIAMCFSMLSVVSFAETETELMGEIGDLVNNYRDRVWDWQGNQFGAMTDEQTAAIEAVWASYEEKKDDLYTLAEELANELATEKVLANDTMMDLYKWKLMRDIMEEKIDVTSEDENYVDWLNRFTEYEKANDLAISADKPTAALGNLGGYSKDLTTFYAELAEMVYNGLVLEGEDAEKANLYVKVALAELGYVELTDEDEAKFAEALKADVVELAADGMFNAFDLGMQVATNKINEENTDGVFKMIPDRDMKASFLILGEDFVRYLLDLIPTVRGKLLSMQKDELVPVVMPYATALLGEDNNAAVDAMYSVTKEVAKYVAGKDFSADAVKRISDEFGVNVEESIDLVSDAVYNAMNEINANLGLVLIHYNTFLGRELLRYENEGEWTKLNGAEIDGDTVASLVLGFAHDRYPVVENNLNLNPNVASFDANVDENGIKVSAHEENVGELVIAVTEEANGTATVNVYRGYTDADLDGEADAEEDVYRYVTSFTVTATSEVEEPYVVLDDIDNTTVDGTFTVCGETNLDYVTVAIVKGGETIYAVVYTKAELEAGITLQAPAGAEEGDVYTVVVGTDKASDSKEFEIEGADEEYIVELEDVADVTVDGIITVKGTTNLDYVTVAIVKGGETIYAVVYTKAEFEAGIAMQAPAGAEEGDVYTVVVGTDKKADSDDFKIIATEEEYIVELEDVEDTTVDGTITVKGTTNLDYVTVAIVKTVDGEPHTIYAVVYEKAEFEAGITLQAPAGAEEGDVYTVVVGTDKKSDSDDFTIKTSTTPVAPSGSLAISGSTTRKVKVGKTTSITATPQNIKPDGATVEIVWETEDGEIIEITDVVTDENNNASIATITKLAKGTATLTVTLYVNGEKVDSKEITVKNPSYSGGGSYKPEEPTEEPTVDDGDKAHSCEWPDIAATATKSAHWAHKTIDQMTINGYIKGYPDGTFKPDQNITRAEFSAIVYRILGLQEAEDGVSYDDTVGHWAEGIVATMSLPEGYGMLRGYGDGNFGPNDNITREQAVAIIARAKSAVWVAAEEGAKDVFADSEDISWWFDGEMDAAVTNGLITGYEDGSYKPLDFTTRAEACTLLARAWPEIIE